MAKGKKKRAPSKAMMKHHMLRLISIGKRLFTEADAAGVEPETLAKDARERAGIVAYEDTEFDKLWQQLVLRPAFRRTP